MSGEFERIARIEKIFARTRPDVLVGIGDDAAVLARPKGSPVVSVDTAVENVHFRREWLSLRDVGYRSFMAAASDLAAMAAEPKTALLSLILPSTFTDHDLDELCLGCVEAADECGMAIIGGNLAAGCELSITTTVMGEVEEGKALTRSGAKPGDRIYVTGDLGSAALGLEALRRGRQDEELFRPFVERWRRPRAAFEEARRIRDFATACIDVSDGLLQDLSHLVAPSGVGAEVELANIPTLPSFLAACATLGIDRTETLVRSGEEYALVFTAPPDRSPPLGKRIGALTAHERGLRTRDENGRELSLVGLGFEHFRSNAT